MKRKFLWRRMGALLLCIVLGICAGTGEGRAKTDEKMTLQSYVESRGAYYGEYGDCMYTYTKNKKEIKIIGFRMKAKNVKIPNKIKGKKVAVIDLVPRWKYDEINGGSLKLNVQSLTLPKYLRKIETGFNEYYETAPSLKEYHITSDNKKFKTKDGVLFSKGGKTLISFPQNKKSKIYRVPNKVTKIGKLAFSGCKKIDKVVMCSTVKSIGRYAFGTCSIKEASLSKNLQFMEAGAFAGSKIKEVTIPGKVKVIPGDCFSNCQNLKKVVVKQGVKKMESNSFIECKKLKKVYIPASVKEMDGGTFVYISSHFPIKKVNVTMYVDKKNRAYKKERWKKYGIKVKVLSSGKSKKIF